VSKHALITGVTGQDGAYMARFLVEKGYEVYGTYRRLSTPNFWRLQYLGIFEKIYLIPIDLSDTASIVEALKIAERLRLLLLLLVFCSRLFCFRGFSLCFLLLGGRGLLSWLLVLVVS